MMKIKIDLYWTKPMGLHDFLQLIFNNVDIGKDKNCES